MGNQACKTVDVSAVPKFMQDTVEKWASSPTQYVSVVGENHNASNVFLRPLNTYPLSEEDQKLDQNKDSFVTIDEVSGSSEFQKLIDGKNYRIILAVDARDASWRDSSDAVACSYFPFGCLSSTILITDRYKWQSNK